MMNSAGRTGATPISQSIMPLSTWSDGLVSASHFTKNASSGFPPTNIPLLWRSVRKVRVRWVTRSHVSWLFGSNVIHAKPASKDRRNMMKKTANTDVAPLRI